MQAAVTHCAVTQQFLVRPAQGLAGVGWQVFGSLVIGWMVLLAFVALCLGAWPMLPFCGLEILVVAWAWRFFWKSSRYRETLTVENETVVAQRWRKNKAPSESLRLPKAWAHVRVEWSSRGRDSRPAEPKVLLQAMGKRFEMGCCLGGEQRLALARQVEHWLALVQSEAAQIEYSNTRDN